jgi:hypothetical protein
VNPRLALAICADNHLFFSALSDDLQLSRR